MSIGGAICCLLELCVLDSFRQDPVFPPHDDISSCSGNSGTEKKNSTIGHGGDTLKYLEVSFLSPCKGDLEVTVEHHTLGDTPRNSAESNENGIRLPIGSVASKIYSEKDKKKTRILVEASYSY